MVVVALAGWLSSNIVYHSGYLFGAVGDKNWWVAGNDLQIHLVKPWLVAIIRKRSVGLNADGVVLKLEL